MKGTRILGAKEVGDFLAERACKLGRDAVIYYTDLAKHFNLPEITSHWSKHPLCEIFRILDEEDAHADRPFRTVLVISEKQKIPSEGFFKKFAELHPEQSEAISKNEKLILCRAEFQKLLQHCNNCA
jgi:hypothetical protein